MTTLSFLGATGTVTGSRFLLRGSTASVLVDCGLFQGLKKLRLRNWDPAHIPVRELDAVVLTHAHLDHSGYLPALVAHGYRGPIFATPATIELAEIVLRDSAKLQDEDAAFAQRHGFSRHSDPKALYTVDDVEETLPLFAPTSFRTQLPIAPDVSLTMNIAGHILGSASASITIDGLTVTATGDLGRPGHPLLRPPDPPLACDVALIESTYGDRQHPPPDLTPLRDAIVRTIERGGTVIIPAFAVDRTEVILMALRALTEAHSIPRLPVYVDSPMALRALNVYREALANHEADIRPDISLRPDPFDPGQLREATTSDESRAINAPAHPSIIISASGMATGGRVLHHLKALLPDRRNTVILAGYQAAGTRGRDLADGASEVKIHGDYVPVEAEIVDIGSFSVHADSTEVIEWLSHMPAPPRHSYVVHGEPHSAESLRQRIASELGWNVSVPTDGETVDLST